MTRSALRRPLVGLDTLVFLTVVGAILAIGLVITHEKTPTALTTPTIAAATTPCQQRQVSVGWRVGPIDGRNAPEVTGLVLAGLLTVNADSMQPRPVAARPFNHGARLAHRLGLAHPRRARRTAPADSRAQSPAA